MRPYSTVVPAYNAARTLPDTIQSILSQTAPCDDIVVVDDGSDDATPQIAADFGAPVKVVRQENRGPGAATNAGIAVARHSIIAFLDADDLWLPEKMASQLVHLPDDGKPAMCAGAMQTFHHAEGPGHLLDIRPGATRSTLAVTRVTADAVGALTDPPGGRGDLIDWLARAREIGVSLYVSTEVLALRRILPGSLSYGRDPARDRGYLEVARQAMLRRKAREGQK